MRLGKHDITIVPSTLASRIYQNNKIERRHRHRYEFNQDYRQTIEENGMVLSGHSDKGEELKFWKFQTTDFILPSSIIRSLVVFQANRKNHLKRS